jgi:FkbM family methyltransferase
MPTTREEHISYTKHELENYQYYKNAFNYLSKKNIKTYLDLGANVGEYSNIVLNKIPTIEYVYLIEPEKENYEFLLKHVSNKVNYESFNVAIGYGIKKGFLSTNGNVGGFKLNGEGGVEVAVTTFEDMNIPVVDLLKMDVEGFEYNIIENSTYLKKVKYLDIEFHQTPKQVGEGFIPSYLKENMRTHEIIVFDENPSNKYGRCVLKLIKL